MPSWPPTWADGCCQSQVDVLVKHCATLLLHPVKERFGSTVVLGSCHCRICGAAMA